VGVDDRAGGLGGVDRRAHDEDRLVLVTFPLEGEHPVAGHMRRADHAHLQERLQPGVQRGPRR
jgi:hypothetical protein